ncbi:MAG: hypothetical protein ACT4OI_09425 [Methanobacteriota archaeon]
MATVLEEIRAFELGAAVSGTAEVVAAPTLLERLRKFLWLWSGMFSVGCLASAFAGYTVLRAFESAGTNFLAAIVSAGLFGVASFLRFGPDSE